MVIIFSAKNNLTWIKFCAVKHIETLVKIMSSKLKILKFKMADGLGV